MAYLFDNNTNTNSVTSGNNPINDLITLYSPIVFKSFKYNSTINNTTVKQALWVVENNHLESILGKDIFNDFINEFKIADGNPNKLTDGSNTIKRINYKELWYEARMYVIEEAAKHLAFELTYPLSPSGVKQQIVSNDFVTETPDFKVHIQYQEILINSYKSKLLNYVNEILKKDTACPNVKVPTYTNPIIVLKKFRDNM